jgi:hypothetical protein
MLLDPSLALDPRFEGLDEVFVNECGINSAG